jgi:hypothetical protein
MASDKIRKEEKKQCQIKIASSGDKGTFVLGLILVLPAPAFLAAAATEKLLRFSDGSPPRNDITMHKCEMAPSRRKENEAGNVK